MSLTYVSSSPASAETGIFLNATIKIKFDGVLTSDYVTPAQFLLQDTASLDTVNLEVAVNPADTTEAVVVPKVYLKEFTSYKLVAIGKNTNTSRYLRGSTGDLETSITILFTTGDKFYTHDPTVELKTSGDFTREGDLFLPSNVRVISSDLRLLSTNPPNFSHHKSYADIYMKFNLPLADASTGHVNTAVYPMLDTTDYVYDTANNGAINFGTGALTGTVSLSDAYTLKWSLASAYGGAIPYKNVYVIVNLGTGIVASGDATKSYSGSSFAFNSTVYPDFAGNLHTVKRELNAVLPELRDDYLGFLFLKNFVQGWERCGRAFSLGSYSNPAFNYAINSTVVDVIEDKDLEKFLVAGTRRQLGDLNVSVDSLIGRAALKYTRASKAVEKSLATLIKESGVRRILMGNPESTFFGNRLWWGARGKYINQIYQYSQDPIPGANVTMNRQAKVPPHMWFI